MYNVALMLLIVVNCYEKAAIEGLIEVTNLILEPC